MVETWHLLHSSAGPSAWNMATDEALLEAAARLGQPVLRFYAWCEPAATFGYFQSVAAVGTWTRLRPLIRRPTGGGLVPHDADWTYSLVFPPGHPWFTLRAVESYRRLHEWIHQAFATLGITTQLSGGLQKTAPGQCFHGAEKFDLLRSGAKIAGAAQRRNRHGLLIQGSIQPGACPCSRSDWEQAMCETMVHSSGIEWRPLVPDAALLQRADQLAADKYSQAWHNERR